MLSGAVLRILWKPNISVRITQTVALGETGLGQEPPGDTPTEWVPNCGPRLVTVHCSNEHRREEY